MGLLEDAASEIRELADSSTRKRYAAALADSLRIDETGQEPPQVMSASEIAAEHDISIDDLDAYHIVIRRRQIKDFLRRYGKKIKSSEITLRLKSQAYEEYFKRPVPRGGNGTKRSPILYTYAEVFQRFGVNSQIDLPDEVSELFEAEGISFP